MFRLAIDVGEIAPAAARNENLFARTIGVLNHGDAASAFTRLRRAHKPGGTGAKNQDIKLAIQGKFQCAVQSRMRIRTSLQCRIKCILR